MNLVLRRGRWWSLILWSIYPCWTFYFYSVSIFVCFLPVYFRFSAVYLSQKVFDLYERLIWQAGQVYGVALSGSQLGRSGIFPELRPCGEDFQKKWIEVYLVIALLLLFFSLCNFLYTSFDPSLLFLIHFC